MATIRAELEASGVLAHVVLPTELNILLDELDIVGALALDPGQPEIRTGRVKLSDGASKSPFPGLDLGLCLPTGVVDDAFCKLRLTPAAGPSSFQFWIALAEQGQAHLAFQLFDRIPGLALTGADPKPAPTGGVDLVANGTRPKIVSESEEVGAALGPALFIGGDAGGVASLKLTVDTDSSEGGLVRLGFDQPYIVFGSDSHFGFALDEFIIDNSTTLKADGNGPPGFAADDVAWQGLVGRQLDFYLPATVPFVGGEPIRGYFAIPSGPGSPELVIETKVPPRAPEPGKPGRPGFVLRVECVDPTAMGLSGLTPTLVRVTMDLPIDQAKVDSGGLVPGADPGSVEIAAGKPLRFIATFARDPVNAPGEFKAAIGVSGQGSDGLVSIRSVAGGPLFPKFFDIAALTATALLADERVAPQPDGSGVLLSKLAAAGAALSAMFNPETTFVLHGVEIESEGQGVPIGGKLTLTLDYTVSASIVKLEFAGIGVGMRPDQPMRVRVRNAKMTVDPHASGLAMIALDFDHAELEIENPGAWDIGPLANLFDVLGSRSGRGSTWVEVDLRFKLNLGPVQVSGMTLRATIDAGGHLALSVQGLAVKLSVPGVMDGEGQLQLTNDEGGFSAYVKANVIPLKIAADASITYRDPMVVLTLDVDLPAPIPLANTGFGLFGIGGVFGASAKPHYADENEDPVLRQLRWTPHDASAFAPQAGEISMGFEAAVGTLPDFGFSFSAKAGILVSVPDVAVRGSLNGHVLSPPVKLTDPSYPPGEGVSFLGFVGVDATALTFAVVGSVKLPPLLEISIPIAGHFPFDHPDDWYTYLGADGYPDPKEGRAIGPISAKVLPDILGIRADAYLMLRGHGITNWPYGRDLPGPPFTLSDGFVIALGFGFESSFGPRPIAWAELSAGLDLLVGASPPTLAGFGHAGGSLNLGPFSLGVEARLSFIAQQAATYIWAQVTGKIELLFFDVEGTVTVTFGDENLDPHLPPPDQHPLDRPPRDDGPIVSTPVLTDDSYRVLQPLVEDPDAVSAEMTAWPDAMVSLPFGIMPIIGPNAADQFPGVAGPVKPAPGEIGSEMLRYRWTLNGLGLVDVTDAVDKLVDGVAPAGKLAARWQASRGVGGEVSELLLFSTAGDLWVNRLSDGGASLPQNPIAGSANACTWQAHATPGWAVGFLGRQAQAGFRLPPDPVSLDPLVSRVSVEGHHFAVAGATTLVPLEGHVTFDPHYAFAPARLVRFDQSQDLKRVFEGYFAPERLDWLPGPAVRPEVVDQQSLVLITPEINDALLVLVGKPTIFDTAEPGRGVIVHCCGVHWQAAGTPQAIERDLVAAFFTSPADMNKISRIEIVYPLSADVGIVGLRATTQAAIDAAAAQTATNAALTASLAQAASAGPPQQPEPLDPNQRAILKPGRLYRLDIDLSWAGTLYKQDEQGTRMVAHDEPGPVSIYTRGADVNAKTLRRLFFRTTPKPEIRTSGPAGHPDYSRWLHQRQDVFQPEMIARYLGGYEPAQSEKFRFPADPIKAHFKQSHVVALAKAYGFKLSMAVRRLDKPGAESRDPRLYDFDLKYGAARVFLDPIDRFRLDAITTSVCAQPSPGATATVAAELATNAMYEAYVQALPAPPDATITPGRLLGVTFSTSRWATPGDMLAGLGFAVKGGPAAGTPISGDLPTPATLQGRLDADDAGFEAALVQLGLPGWPVPKSPRLSRLWVSDGADGWLFAGLMLESVEPIVRPGRLDLPDDGVALDMGTAGAAVRFDVRRSDAGRFRLLLMTGQPVRVITSEQVVVGKRVIDLPGHVGGPLDPRGPLHVPIFAPHALAPKLVVTMTVNGQAAQALVSELGLPTLPSFAGDP